MTQSIGNSIIMNRNQYRKSWKRQNFYSCEIYYNTTG